MNTWLTDIIRRTNERAFSETDLARIMAYYARLPIRLKLGEELEKQEPTLARKLHEELARRFPDRPLYTRPLAQDLVESLRHVNLAVLADDTKLLKLRWTDHLARLLPALGVEPLEVRDAYLVLRELLETRLTGSAWEAFRPAFDEMTEALSTIPAPTLAV
ncbi:MAG: hypothetical protein C0467_15665 [Planctomycetaceae bacterium]|nr:hypothetical protein [Planctomycetaceae bacterium]